MNPISHVRAMAAVVAALGIVACSSSSAGTVPLGGACHSPGDCADNGGTALRWCCDSASDGRVNVCRATNCYAPGGGSGPPAQSPSFYSCRSTANCQSGNVCVDTGYCKPICTSSGQCAAYPYPNLTCRPVSGASGVSVCDDQPPSEFGGGALDGGGGADGSPPPPACGTCTSHALPACPNPTTNPGAEGVTCCPADAPFFGCNGLVGCSPVPSCCSQTCGCTQSCTGG